MPPVNFLIKPVSGSCNLECSYCFYRSEAENRTVASYGTMSGDTLKAVVEKGLRYSDAVCGFAFQGGEPTLAGLGFFQELVELERKYDTGRVKVLNSIQTNGTLLNEEWARFLHDNHFLVGLSLDGPQEVHDLNRPDRNRNGTWNRVLKAAGLLNRYRVQYNVLSVVTSHSSRHAGKIYDFFKKNGFWYLQFIPCLPPPGTGDNRPAYALKSGDLERFLKKLFDKWYGDFAKGDYVSVRYFDNLVRMIGGQRPEACNMRGTCGCGCVIEADGGMYPCDFYVLDRWKLGNIKTDAVEDMLRSETARTFIKSSETVSETCRKCGWFRLCRCGCRRECEPLPQDGGRANIFCKDYKGFLDYAYERLAHVSDAVSAR